jgi:hypothetical protein
MAHEQDLQHRVLKAAKMKPMIVNSKLSSMVVKRSDLGAEAWQPADGHRSKSCSTLLPGLPRHIRMNCISTISLNKQSESALSTIDQQILQGLCLLDACP